MAANRVVPFMRREIEITTSVYDKPYRTVAMYDETNSQLKIKWKQKGEDEPSESFYEILMDKETGVATIHRTGDISSKLVFDTSKPTKGVLDTPYGNIVVDIKTEYINMPSLIAPKFEICYYMSTFEDSNSKNVFSVNLLLQK